MRLLPGFALILVGIALAQSQLVVPQFNNLNGLISLLPQVQGFVGQLNNILPQLSGVLSSAELNSLKDKLVQLLLSQVGNKPDLNAIKDAILPLLQQYLGSKPQSRIDIDQLLQQIAGAAASALPGIVLALLGKRDLEAADGRNLLNLANQFQLTNILPQIQSFLTPDKFQQLQSQFLSTVATAVGNNWNAAALGQALQQLISQFVPQAAQMRIDWEQVGQSALDGLVTALPSILIGALSLFGKRAVNFNYQQILSQLQTSQLAQLVQVVLNSDKGTVLSKLRQLLQQFFPNLQERINFDDLAAQVLAQLNNLLPNLGQSIFSSIFG